MRSPRRLLVHLALVASVGGGVPALHAQEAGRSIGEPGRTVMARNGTVFEVSPYTLDGWLVEGEGEPGEMLVLTIRLPDGSVHYEIVPTTDDPSVERAPWLVYVESTDSVYLFWEERFRVHTRIDFIARGPEGNWSDLREVAGRVFYTKDRAQAIIANDSLRTDPGNGAAPTSTARTIIHLVWREETGEVFYAPVTGEDHDEGRNLFVNLSDLFDVVPQLGAGIDAPLSLERGPDLRSAVISFADPLGGRLEVVGVAAAPLGVSRVADEVSRIFEDFDADQPVRDLGDLVAVNEDARARIIQTGRSVNRHLGPLLSAEASKVILAASADTTIGELDRTLHEELVHAGLAMDPDYVTSDALGAPALLHTASTGSSDDRRRPGTTTFSLRRLASYPLPADLPSDFSIASSPNGEKAVLFWELHGSLWFTEWDAEAAAWTGAVQVRSEDAAAGLRLVRQRVGR